jgi:murein DD-endopeptidase MepM/ murein hydrolase activator NlpD
MTGVGNREFASARVKFARSDRAGRLVLGVPVNSNKTMGGALRLPGRRARLRVPGFVGVGILLVAGALFAGGAPAAYATTYPTWADVVAARANTAKAKAEAAEIQGDLTTLNTQLTAADAAAQATALAAATAEQNYTLAAEKEQTLQAQEADAAAKAAKSKQELAGFASQLARGPSAGESWSTISLMLNGKTAGQLLNNLGAIRQISTEEDGLLEKALSDQNSVKQLTALASAQTKILDVQKQAADAAKATAAAAEANLQVLVEAATVHEQQLTVQLAALTTDQAMTEQQYDAGVAAADGAGQAGVVDSAGWALPTVGVITSPWGYRYDPAQGYAWAFHYGDDIAHGCLQPIYAAAAGTVTYAGVYSDYGNYITINHGNGISTSYGHIANGETFVHVGESVSAGQNIARTGSTGASTGCHLYFAVMQGGSWTDPVPFMRARGITIG